MILAGPELDVFLLVEICSLMERLARHLRLGQQPIELVIADCEYLNRAAFGCTHGRICLATMEEGTFAKVFARPQL